MDKEYRLKEIEKGWISTRRSDWIEACRDKEYNGELVRALWKQVNEKGTICYDDWELLNEFGDKNLREKIRKRCTYQIVGMRSKKYWGDGPSSYWEELEKNIICCTNGDKKYEIALWTDYIYDSSLNIRLCQKNCQYRKRV